MKKSICLLLTTFALAGCGHKVPTGVIDCYSIKVDGSTTYIYTYQESYSEVHEYESPTGKKLYLNCRLRTYDAYGDFVDTKIIVQTDRYDNKSITEFSYVDRIGYLMMENNYYYDSNKRTIDVELKFSRYNHDMSEYGLNNRQAYNCAKQGYYTLSENTLYSEIYRLHTDTMDSSLSRHQYVSIGDDAIVTYVKKWY